MAKLPRVHQKIFAENAIDKEIGQFGSAVAGSKKETGDIAEIQALDAWKAGWSVSTVSKNRYPAMQERNGIDKVITQQLAYMFQEGIPEWDVETEYFKGSLVKVLDDNKIKLYMSLQNENIGHLITETDWWEEVSLGGKNEIGDPILTLSSTLGENEIWLEGAEVSRETYAQLFEIYGTAYGEGDGETTFNLPDFRNRTLWGAEDFGYIEAGLPNITGTFHCTNIIFETGSSGAFTYTQKNAGTLDTSGALGTQYTNLNDFNASRSSSIYGNSTTVQPPSVKVRVKTRFA